MENFNTIEHFLDNMAPDTVYKTRKGLLPGVIIIAAGIACFASVNIFEWSANSIYPALLLSVGAVVLVFGLIKAFYRPSYYVAKANGQKLRAHEINFEVNEKDKLVRLYNSNKFDEISPLKRTHNNGLKIRVMCTKDLKLCFSQVICYVPFEFVALTAPLQHTEEQIAQLKQML